MKAVILNRILIALGFVGLFIAGILSLAKLENLVVPCGVSSGCDIVTNHPSSKWFGVPVAYLGLGAYIVLTLLAIARSMKGPDFFQRSTLVSYVFAAGGTLISIGLQFYSFIVIGQMCKWCLGSAVTMTLTLVVTAFLYQEVSERPLQASVATRKGMEFVLPSVLAVFLALGLMGMNYQLHHSDIGKIDVPHDLTLVPSNPNLYGDVNAPVTIIEFADLNCFSCQTNSPLVKEFVREHQGKVRLIYRHFPLPIHKTSQIAAAIDEYAAEKGHFWDYTMAVMSNKKEFDDANDLFQIAGSLNMDVDDIKKRLANDKDPIYARLSEDESVANRLGISATPTFIVMAPGVETKAFGPNEVREALQNAPYQKLIGGS